MLCSSLVHFGFAIVVIQDLRMHSVDQSSPAKESASYTYENQ